MLGLLGRTTGGAFADGVQHITRPQMTLQTPRSFNSWLRSQLKEKKMSQRQLALQSGVDHSTISRLIKGDRMPSLGTATKLARGLRGNGVQRRAACRRHVDVGRDEGGDLRKSGSRIAKREIFDRGEIAGLRADTGRICRLQH